MYNLEDVYKDGDMEELKRLQFKLALPSIQVKVDDEYKYCNIIPVFTSKDEGIHMTEGGHLSLSKNLIYVIQVNIGKHKLVFDADEYLIIGYITHRLRYTPEGYTLVKSSRYQHPTMHRLPINIQIWIIDKFADEVKVHVPDLPIKIINSINKGVKVNNKDKRRR